MRISDWSSDVCSSDLHDIGRAEYVSATDREALDAFQLCSRIEGIIPALEPAHALAHVRKLAPQMAREQIIVMNLCGRGDKDVFRSEEHTSELQSLMRISYAVFCLKKKNKHKCLQ